MTTAKTGMELSMDGKSTIFTPQTLQYFPNHAIQIAMILSTFSLIEGTVLAIYGMLKDQSIETVNNKLFTKSFGIKLSATREALKEKYAENIYMEYDKLFSDLQDFSNTKRNEIAHAMWGYEEGDYNFLRHISVQQYLKNNPITKGFNNTVEDYAFAPAEIYKSIKSYSVEDLVSIRHECDSLYSQTHEFFFMELLRTAEKRFGNSQ